LPSAHKSQLSMAESPAFDRIVFAQCPPYKPDCACALQRKAADRRRSIPSSPFSPVRFVDEILRNTGMFRVFRGKG